MRLGATVLAGGRSSRMGRPKALLMFEGASFVVRAIDLVAVRATAVVVVTGVDDAATRELVHLNRPGVVVTKNADPDRGQLSSLITGLDALPADIDGLLVALVDQPSIRRRTVDLLADVWRDHRPPVVRPSYRGQHGHPVIFDAGVFAALRRSPLDRGARNVVRALGAAVRDVEVDDPGVVRDIDTVEEYERAVEESAQSRTSTTSDRQHPRRSR